jgi:transposase
MRQVATRLGVGPETVRKWVRQAEVNAGLRPGVSESENVEIRRLKKEFAELKRTNEILRTASAFLQRSQGEPRRDDPIRRCVS